VIKKEKVDAYIQKIPPAPETLNQTLLLLDQGELVKAAQVAKEDLALNSYLVELVNKPIYGFRNTVTETSQIFGILGLERSQQAVYNYMISLLSPAKWQLFQLNKTSFYDLQAELTTKWQQILSHLEIEDAAAQNAIALLPASIIVSEALFCEKIDDVNLLRSVDEIDLNTILVRLCGMDLFDICERIAIKWNMHEKSAQIVQSASGLKPTENEAINKLGKWMHLLLFHTLSQPTFINAGLNDFIDFQIDFVEDIYGDFAQLMDIS
jgi:HD-like signal output (HDOD) protein